MVSWKLVCEQIGRTKQPKSNVSPLVRLGLKSETEFQDTEEMPDGSVPVSIPDTSSFEVIKKQIGKKGISKKSKRDRIADKGIRLAESLTRDA